MCLAQLSKIFCYSPKHPYLIVIPYILLSAGMLFFFTLGASMVGDVCDEDELKTGRRSEGSYYSVYWWFIKMGTALASFVAGLLIVFTQFDEVQVTKVDDLQGSIKELQARVHNWSENMVSPNTNTMLVENTQMYVSKAIKDSKEYLKYLDIKSQKKQKKKNQTIPLILNQKKELLSDALSETKSNIRELEQLQGHIDEIGSVDSTSRAKIIHEIIPLTLQTSLSKTRLNSDELLWHFEDKSRETTKSKKHYEKLIEDITRINNRLTSVSTQSSLNSFDKELDAIEKKTTALTLQSPYTLLMMRVVEIGLPVILSIVSIFLALYYPLTEKRCHEIKELLKQRNNN